MTRRQELKIGGWVVLAWLLIFVLVAYSCQPMAFGEENTPNSYDLPRDQVQEYRALEAEARALKAEATLAIQEIEAKRNEILLEWKTLVGGDFKKWQLDLKNGRLQREKESK